MVALGVGRGLETCLILYSSLIMSLRREAVRSKAKASSFAADLSAWNRLIGSAAALFRHSEIQFEVAQIEDTTCTR